MLVGVKSSYLTDEKPTGLKDITSYNNFYEFGVDKADPAANAYTLTTTIDGMVDKPADYLLEDLVSPAAIEERIYIVALKARRWWSLGSASRLPRC